MMALSCKSILYNRHIIAIMSTIICINLTIIYIPCKALLCMILDTLQGKHSMMYDISHFDMYDYSYFRMYDLSYRTRSFMIFHTCESGARLQSQ